MPPRVEMPTFYFDGYTLRPAEGDANLALAAEWMRLDVWHRGLFTPEFWLQQGRDTNSFILQDEAGGPIFFFKTLKLTDQTNGNFANGVEIFIQFAPEPGLRTMLALEKGFAWMQKRLGALGYDAVYFTSRNPKLIEFTQKRLGFVVAAEVEHTGTRLKAYLERAA